jgi:hypothetical protein
VARLNVEQKALTDPRFRIVGGAIGALTHGEDRIQQAVGLYLCMQVWDYCQEHCVYVVPAVVLRAIHAGLPEALRTAGLATKVRGGWRIHGTEGRIEWLQRHRNSNKERQERYRQRVSNALVTGPSRGALTLTPALTPEKEQEPEAPRFAHNANATMPPSVLVFPTTGAGPKTWDLTPDQIAEWANLYPGVDVASECRKALAWIQANHPKTAGGMPRFLVRWLNRVTDQRPPAPEKRNGTPDPKARPKLTPEQAQRMVAYRMARSDLEREVRSKHPGMPHGDVLTLVSAELKRKGLTA